MILIRIAAICILIAAFSGCQTETVKLVESTSLQLFNNYGSPDTLILEMDLSDGPYRGIIIPSPYAEEGKLYLHFSFEVVNRGPNACRIAYQLCYQNSSYKHPELIKTFTTWKENPKSSDNFYGSWLEDSITGFKFTPALQPGEAYQVTDSIRIGGNPRNEWRYFGNDDQYKPIADEEVQKLIDEVMSNEVWLAHVAEKARKRNNSLEKQLRDDAIWTLENQEAEANTNQRWKRNPRVGNYEFMLLTCTEQAHASLPDYIVNIGTINESSGRYTNPFAWTALTPLPEGVDALSGQQVLRTYAVLRPEYGIYHVPQRYAALAQDNPGCTSDLSGWARAHFSQFDNAGGRDSSLNNIQAIAQVGGANFSRAQYEKLKRETPRKKDTWVQTAEAPCRSVYLSENGKEAIIENPGNTVEPFRKENAAIEGRFGFTYGKWRARISFPETLSNENIWNGLTCAYWLKFQSEESWNMRGPCEKEGYVVAGEDKKNATFSTYDTYSEIDIEIVKESPEWAGKPYGHPANQPMMDQAAANRNMVVACTNWDRACADPPRFASSKIKFKHDGRQFESNRWYRWYKAITIKTERHHDHTVGRPLYYEIDWRPEAIYWRIGESLDKLELVGYMDASGTKIPDNQMLPVMSQEWHYAHWWPTTPFPQGSIPYPAQPIRGVLYEIVIE